MSAILPDYEFGNVLGRIPVCEASTEAERILRAHDAALRAENKRLAEALREIDARTGHFGEAPPPPEWMPMLSLIAWVGRTARAALAEHRDAKAAAPEGEKEGERG